MRRACLIAAFAIASVGALRAQSILLDDFNGSPPGGSVRPGTTWVGNVTPNASTLTVGRSAKDDNGWGVTGLTLNAAQMSFVTISAQRDAGNAAPSLVVQFEDRSLATHTVAVSTAAFATGTLTAVQLPIGAWPAGFDATQIVGWSIGGGAPGLVDFRMTFDSLGLSAGAVPGLSVQPVVSGSYEARTVAAGSAVTFAITATGTAPLSYQWRKNSAPIAGATNASLIFASVVPTDAGSYVCAVTNAAGTTLSGSFVLSVTARSATVVLGNLAATYSGAAKTVSATTSPAGLAVVFSYNGSANPPVNAGTYPVVATIQDPAYAGTAAGTLVIAKSPQSIALGALPITLSVGVPFPVTATASSGGAVTLAVAGGNATLSNGSLTTRDAGLVRLRATQAGDENFLPASTEFFFTTAKQNQSIAFAPIAAPPVDATRVTVSATASSGLPVSFNVIRGPGTLADGGIAIAGPGTIVVRASQAGNDAFNAAPDVDREFTVTTSAAPVSPVVPPAPVTPVTPTVPTTPTTPVTPAIVASRLVNISTRTRAGSGDQVAIAGFVITGDAPKPVLVRAVGPSLGAFGVADAIAAPKLELFREAALVGSNTGWATGGASATQALATAAERVGAFALGAGTADSALLATLAPGNYTAVISASDGRTGVGLVEVYDLSAAASGARVSNLSVRAVSGSESDTLIVGLVVEGTAPQRLLIRAIGPALAQFGVSGVLVRPQLAVFSGANEIARNSGWSASPDAAAIAAGATRVGAFALPDGSADAALVLHLAPGAYTAQVSSGGAAGGVALVEIYELP